MLVVSRLAADALGESLKAQFDRTFGSSHRHLGELLETTARLTVECIGISDALYHDVEHTMMVTGVGLAIIRGRTLLEPTTPLDWVHYLIACLLHDVGYVRGLLRSDEPPSFVTDGTGGRVTLPRGATDAALMPYHVDRGKLFVMERLSNVEFLDAARIARAIEYTRFPHTSGAEVPGEEAKLVRAADLVGQLGDPGYLRKANALFTEFRETGLHERLGYASPADLVEAFPAFFWSKVVPHIGLASRYLGVTVEGRHWIAHLHANLFTATHGASWLASDLRPPA